MASALQYCFVVGAALRGTASVPSVMPSAFLPLGAVTLVLGVLLIIVTALWAVHKHALVLSIVMLLSGAVLLVTAVLALIGVALITMAIAALVIGQIRGAVMSVFFPFASATGIVYAFSGGPFVYAAGALVAAVICPFISAYAMQRVLFPDKRISTLFFASLPFGLGAIAGWSEVRREAALSAATA